MKNVFQTKVTIYGCDHVQHKWLSDIPWKMQTVVNQALRAPDTHYCRALKILCRWMRSVCLQNADKNHTFMCKKKQLPELADIENEINYCSVHFATHLVYGLEIIAYKHDDPEIRSIAMKYYSGIVCELWHFRSETEDRLDIRLSDVDRKPKIKECPKDEKDDPYLRRFEKSMRE